MSQWYMLTVVGNDRPGIVAGVTQALFEHDCHLGEASMMRLGGSFSIMLMVQFAGDADALVAILGPVAEVMSLRLHVDPIVGLLHQHREPDVRITVFGADRAGIVAQVTGALAEAGLDILDLASDVAGTDAEPIYAMQIEGVSRGGAEQLQEALTSRLGSDVDVRVESIETLIG